MADVLLATCAELPTGDADDEQIVAALAGLGMDAHWAVWNDPDVDWADPLVVLRSTWDYTGDRPAFLRWVDALGRVANTADMVRWNTDKTYLRDLAEQGVPIVPTAFVAPGEPVQLPTAGEYVIKPSVGAGSRGAGRFGAGDGERARAHAVALHDAGRTVLVQPYPADVDDAGETALVYFDAEFSHAVRKGPMLPVATSHPVDGWELYVEENITAREPSDAELAVGAVVLGALATRFGGAPLYARVDLLPAPTGPVLIELELTEPSLFFGYGGPDALAAFARATAARR